MVIGHCLHEAEGEFELLTCRREAVPSREAMRQPPEEPLSGAMSDNCLQADPRLAESRPRFKRTCVCDVCVTLEVAATGMCKQKCGGLEIRRPACKLTDVAPLTILQVSA